MAVTLEQAKLNTQDMLVKGTIDEFQKSNYLLNNLTFADVVSPSGGGATLTYAYNRLKTQPTAAFRAINSDYTPQEVTKERKSVDLAIFGGSYEIDRVIASMGGVENELTLQARQKIKAAAALFNDTVINGNRTTNTNAFDGLDVAIKGSDTENELAKPIDLSTAAAIETNFMDFLDNLDETLAAMDGTPSALLMSSKMFVKFKAVIRRATMYQETKDNLGKIIPMYDGIPLIDLGAKSGSNDPVVSIDPEKGTTSIYAVRFGLDGFHGVTVAGSSMITSRLPDFSTAGAVKKGDVEMVAAVALKATRAAAVLRNIQIKAATA